SAFDETHPLYLGSGGKATPKAVRQFLDDSDVVFGIGCSFVTTNFGVTMPKVTPERTFIHATLDPADVNKNIPSDYALIGDAQLTLEALICEVCDRLGGKSRERKLAVASKIKSINEAWLQDSMPKHADDSTRRPQYRVIRELLYTVDD